MWIHGVPAISVDLRTIHENVLSGAVSISLFRRDQDLLTSHTGVLCVDRVYIRDPVNDDKRDAVCANEKKVK